MNRSDTYIHLFLARLAAAMLVLTLLAAACTQSELDDATDADATRATAADSTTCWLKLRIAFAHDPADDAVEQSTRASESHGIPNEYQILNGYIVIYKGTTVETSTCVQTVDLTSSGGAIQNDPYYFSKLFESDPSQHITNSGYITLQLNSISFDTGEELFPLILLNYYGTLPTPGDSYTKFFVQTTTDLGSTAKGYLMSNVAMSNVPGGARNPAEAFTNSKGKPTDPGVVTLPEVKAIFTELDAKEDDGKTVFVERVAAKVEVNLDKMKTPVSVNGNDKNKASVHNLEWVVDNRNTSSYIIRHFDAVNWLGLTNSSGRYPMVDDQEVLANYGNKADAYRTMWSEDENYSSLSPSLTYSKYTRPGGGLPNHESAHIHENTHYDASNPNLRKYFTRVVIRVQMKDASKVILPKGCFGVKKKEDKNITMVFSDDLRLKDFVKKTVGSTVGFADVDVKTVSPNAEGKITTGVSAFNDAYEVYRYDDGDEHGAWMYYETFVEHFGANCISGGSYAGLGRYGVVRNNYYNIAIDHFEYLGQPVYPPLDGESAITE